MLIDCEVCVARGDACSDCVVSALLAEPGEPPRAASAGFELVPDEQRALRVLADSGLIAPLRLRTRRVG